MKVNKALNNPDLELPFKPKQNTMDDWNWIDDVADKSEGTGNIYRRDLLIAALTAKLEEVDRAAREWELNWITGLNPKHPDFTKIVKDRLAELRKANSLKGGDV